MDLPITCIILAGGHGHRLGGINKALIRHRDGTSLLDNLILGMRPLITEVLLVIRKEQKRNFESTVESCADKLALHTVFDSGVGPAAALTQGAEFATHECLLVIGADHPFFDLNLIRKLRKVWLEEKNALVAARRYQGPSAAGCDSAQPLWAMYSRNAVMKAASAKDWSHCSLHELVKHLGPRLIESHSKAFLSINKPSDLNSFDCEMPNVDSH
ncbi:MAG: NTP transferase domain-containing protein [Myxococcota bacterium]|nr:NTP transferase domain-containing protein [Myxococcota bacterium]